MTDVQETALRRYREMAELVRDFVPETPRQIPMVRYWDRMIGRYEPKKNTVFLMTPESLAYYHGEPVEDCVGDHEFLFLHELAHWGTGGQGHTAVMYAFLFCLGKLFRYHMLKIRSEELKYKPRAAKLGWRMYLRTFRGTDL